MWVSSAGYDFKPDMSVYDSEQGYTKEQIFVAFLKNEQGLVLQGGTTRITDEARNVYRDKLLELKKDQTLEGLASKIMDVLKEFDERTKVSLKPIK